MTTQKQKEANKRWKDKNKVRRKRYAREYYIKRKDDFLKKSLEQYKNKKALREETKRREEIENKTGIDKEIEKLKEMIK